MTIDQDTARFVQAALPWVTSIATTVLAAIAIIATRRNAKETVASQLSQRMWDKRADVYREILYWTQVQDPGRRPTSKGFKERSDGADGTLLLAFDTDSEEWHRFECGVEAYSSDDIYRLFMLWQSTLTAWAWQMTKAVIHQPPSEYHGKAERELAECYKTTHSARELLAEQIRAELRFEKRKPPRITIQAHRLFGVRRIEVNRDPVTLLAEQIERRIGTLTNKHSESEGAQADATTRPNPCAPSNEPQDPDAAGRHI
ncbi:hypothetical protein [Paractinoplanes globisporus]|uniref:Uncharacterized protein n=1 Tax=Paractinoplanes globisporus TaxID=113565 RepID=A0ABW6WYE7_9ACTN|nr:hypothetical protein [Actinoplanes globisporus]